MLDADTMRRIRGDYPDHYAALDAAKLRGITLEFVNGESQDHKEFSTHDMLGGLIDEIVRLGFDITLTANQCGRAVAVVRKGDRVGVGDDVATMGPMAGKSLQHRGLAVMRAFVAVAEG